MFIKTLRKLGPTAFATYTSISIVSFSSWMTAFYFGLDPEIISDKMNAIRSYFNIQSTPEKSIDESKNHEDGQLSQVGSLSTVIFLSVMAHKLIFPIRIALTAALTPHVNRQLMRRNIDLNAWFSKRFKL